MQPSQIYNHLQLNHIIWPLFVISRLTIHAIHCKEYALLQSSTPCLDMYRPRSHRFIFQTDCRQRRNHNDVRNIDSTNQNHEDLQAAPSAADIVHVSTELFGTNILTRQFHSHFLPPKHRILIVIGRAFDFQHMYCRVFTKSHYRALRILPCPARKTECPSAPPPLLASPHIKQVKHNGSSKLSTPKLTFAYSLYFRTVLLVLGAPSPHTSKHEPLGQGFPKKEIRYTCRGTHHAVPRIYVSSVRGTIIMVEDPSLRIKPMM